MLLILFSLISEAYIWEYVCQSQVSCFIYLLLAHTVTCRMPSSLCAQLAHRCGLVQIIITHIFHVYLTGALAIIQLPQCLWTIPKGYVLIPHNPTDNNSDMIWTEQKITKTTYFMGSPVYQPLVPWWCIPGQGPSCNPGLSCFMIWRNDEELFGWGLI